MLPDGVLSPKHTRQHHCRPCQQNSLQRCVKQPAHQLPIPFRLTACRQALLAWLVLLQSYMLDQRYMLTPHAGQAEPNDHCLEQHMLHRNWTLHRNDVQWGTNSCARARRTQVDHAHLSQIVLALAKAAAVPHGRASRFRAARDAADRGRLARHLQVTTCDRQCTKPGYLADTLEGICANTDGKSVQTATGCGKHHMAATH